MAGTPLDVVCRWHTIGGPPEEQQAIIAESRSGSHRDRVFSEIQKAILTGQLQPGAPLSERLVGRMAKISRVPVREAMILLEAKGLVTLIPDRGAFVRLFHMEEVRHLYEVREGMEGMATRLAAEHIPAECVADFTRRFQTFLNEGGDCDLIHRVNVEFHEAIIANCDNALLQKMLTDIRNQCQLAIASRVSQSRLSEMLQFTRHHLNVAKALERRNGVRAEEIMRDHIATGSRWYAQLRRDLGRSDRPTASRRPADRQTAQLRAERTEPRDSSGDEEQATRR